MSVNSERQPLLQEARSAAQTVRANAPSKAQRIQVAQAMGALQAGKLPSQEQLSKLIQLVLDSDTLKTAGGQQSRTARIGVEGQRVLENIKGVLRATKAWGEEKNGNDLLQNFFYNAATSELDTSIAQPTTPSQKELSRDGQRAIESFRTIASLLTTSADFRGLISDAILLSRDLFADAATVAAEQAKQAAEKTRPSDKERKDGVDLDALQSKGKKVAKGVKSGRLQGQAKESLWDEVENWKQWADETLPEGEAARDRVVSKLQEVVTTAQKNPEYRRSITALLNLGKKYARKAEEAVNEVKDKSEVNDEDEKVRQAGRDLKEFVEKVAGKSLDGVISASQQAGEDIRGDEKLSAYFGSLEEFFERLLYQPGYVTSRAAYNKASSMYDDGQSLLSENEQWKKDAGALQKELEGLANGITNDKATLNLVHAIENLGDSLAVAGQVGIGALKAEGQGLYRDIMDVMVPRLVSLVKEIPVPRVEFKSEDIDLVIDDIKLESASFIPDSIRVVQHNDLSFTQGYATYASEYDASFRLRVSGLHFTASNISFWMAKKTGFMPFEDSGVLDIQFGPKGISFDVTLENADEDDQETFFTVKNVAVSISGFDFTISRNNQWFATWFAKPVLRAFIKRNLTHALEAQIANYLREADFRLYGVQQRAIAAANAKPTPANFVTAVVSDSLFPRQQATSAGAVEVKPTGVVKYGRRGEYILHVGVDEHLFPNKPPANLSNTTRERLRAQSAATTQQARGAADQFKAKAKGAKEDGKKEANDLDAKKKEAQRRESKSEGWRTDAFDL